MVCLNGILRLGYIPKNGRNGWRKNGYTAENGVRLIGKLGGQNIRERALRWTGYEEGKRTVKLH